MTAGGRWTDAALDGLRREGDDRARRCLDALHAEHGSRAASLVFGTMSANDDPPPGDAPPALKEFFADTRDLPPGVERARLRRGEDVFLTHAFSAALVLLAKSLPAGYAAPSLALVLNISGDLIRSPYRRLLGVLQMVVNVCASRGFESGGRAVVTAQKLRLLHEGVRHIARRRMPDFEARYGVPVNHEDMLATILGFSYLALMGCRQLGVGLTREAEEDYWYVWRVFAQCMGLDAARLPDDVDDAGAFYAAYARRHYVPAARNPDGVALAAANLGMLRGLIPRPLRWLGLGVAPAFYMRELLTEEECARVGIPRVHGHRRLRALLALLTRLGLGPRATDARERHVHAAISRAIFQGMIDRAWNGEVRFRVPSTLADLRRLA